jgi:hypothetical protein
MTFRALPPRRLVLHVGATGTKALPTYLGLNRLALAEGGVHYPRAGQDECEPDHFTPGHQRLACDLARPDGGPSLRDLVEEIHLVQAATVVVSSEEFLPLALAPGGLDRIVDAGRDLGYRPTAIVVLRAQPDLLESVYAELAKSVAVPPFEDVIEAALAHGSARPAGAGAAGDLVYSSVVGRLEAVFAGNVVARAYRPDRGWAAGHTDFVHSIGRLRGGLRLANLREPQPSASERVTLLELLANVLRNRGVPFADPLDYLRANVERFDTDDIVRPFSLLTRADRVRFLARFGADNAAVNARCGIDIPFVDTADIALSDADDARAGRHRRLLAATIEAAERNRGTPGRLGAVTSDRLERVFAHR